MPDWEVVPKEKVKASGLFDRQVESTSPKIEQPLTTGDMLVPKRPMLLLLSVVADGSKRFTAGLPKSNSPTDPAKREDK